MYQQLPLSAADAAVFEAFVVPRYLRYYGELALEMLLQSDQARVAHVYCRTGYPDLEVVDRLTDGQVVGFDASPPALEVARDKLATVGDLLVEYRDLDDLASNLEAESFSHVLSVHPVMSPKERLQLFANAARALVPGGQAVIALPLRGSFLELGDLLKEYALKYDASAFGTAVETAMGTMPSIESLSEELEAVGLDDVDVEVRTTSLQFDSGRAFAEDPVSRLMVVPVLSALLAGEDLAKPLSYLREAIDRYWSELTFELTLQVGCASARRPLSQ